MSEPVVPSSSSAPVESSAPERAVNGSQNQQQESNIDSGAPQQKPVGQRAGEGGNKQEQQPQNKQHAPTPAQKEAARRLKLKVDKQEYDLPEDDVVKYAQMGLSAQNRFQEAAKMRKQAEDFISSLKDPKKLADVLRNPAIGVDVRKFAEEYLTQELQMEQLSPAERRAKELEAELNKINDERKLEQTTREQEQQQKLQDHFAQDFDTKFTEVLGSAGLPKSPKTVKRMADYMTYAIENGYEDIEPKNIVELVRQDYMSEIQELFGQTDGDLLLKLLGDGVANKIRRADLARIKSIGIPAPAQPKPEPVEQPKAQPAKKMNLYEFREHLAKQAREGK